MTPFLSQRPRADLPPLVPSSGSSTADFTSLKNGCVHPAADAARPGEARGVVRAPASASGTPRVECVRQGDKVVRIVVTCGCGERIEVDCLYPAGG